MTPRRMQMMMMMRSSRPPQHRLLLLLVILAISSFPLHRSSVNAQDTTSSSSSSPPSYANHVPISYKVNQKQTECIYDIFQQDEQVTFSVFIVEALKNGKPLCNVLIEGPINAQTQQDNNDRRMSLGRMIRQGLLENQQFTKDNTNILKYNMKVDWTHAGEEEDKLLIRQEIERNNSKQRQKYHESSSSNDPYHKPISTYAMSKIEPFEMTRVIPETGYYRVCAQAGLHALVVEMDARSELRMGGVDQVTGHVFTYAKRDLRNEEAAIDNNNKNNINGNTNGRRMDSNTYQSELEELSKILVNQVEDADLLRTSEQIKVLNAKTSDIMTEIQTRMTRIRAHEQSARRNSENLAWSSKVETLMFAVISGFQVYTMRKWLLQNSLLGR